MATKLYQRLSEIDQEASQLKVERESVCEKIHEECEEAKRLEALKYKTTIQNGDYGLYNDARVFFAEHHGKIVLVGLKGTHTEIDMDNAETESYFFKQGNIFDLLGNSEECDGN